MTVAKLARRQAFALCHTSWRASSRTAVSLATLSLRAASGSRWEAALIIPRTPWERRSNIVCTFAEFEADLIRLRTLEGMAIARSRDKVRGKQPKLSDKQ